MRRAERSRAIGIRRGARSGEGGACVPRSGLRVGLQEQRRQGEGEITAGGLGKKDKRAGAAGPRRGSEKAAESMLVVRRSG